MNAVENVKRIHLPEMKIAAFPVLTTNEKEMSGKGKISNEWQLFYQENRSQQIENKKGSSVYAIYTNYELDENGLYTFAIGHEVVDNNSNQVPLFIIPECTYEVFTTKVGPISKIVPEAWGEIWEWSKTNERAFITDFEVYDQRASNPEEAQVDIFISVK
ncbi:effector binding domain-containing protein [Alkalihalobacillus sp. LMS39]|uniref:GyrI-like domain-containing protein n=1 Tax=Alkalihalobacillus sp. LMS39 TaxID=2924032 RepID=UPI001FB2B0C3|nr:effector binding domain-containing protein [Alkalihalobacillus sp. LMS39]UOE92506.1 GyrI-like domain-containing protein [Alkalihalobacillus sp. LMS39]